MLYFISQNLTTVDSSDHPKRSLTIFGPNPVLLSLGSYDSFFFTFHTVICNFHDALDNALVQHCAQKSSM